MRKTREKQALFPRGPMPAGHRNLISRNWTTILRRDSRDRVIGVGAPGLTAEQVRCAVIKQLHLHIAELEFHLVDSQSCQRF